MVRGWDGGKERHHMMIMGKIGDGGHRRTGSKERDVFARFRGL